jgi:hypothetical protein
MVDADEIPGFAALLEGDQRTAMGATILEGIELTITVAGDDNRRVADVCRAKIARLG